MLHPATVVRLDELRLNGERLPLQYGGLPSLVVWESWLQKHPRFSLRLVLGEYEFLAVDSIAINCSVSTQPK